MAATQLESELTKRLLRDVQGTIGRLEAFLASQPKVEISKVDADKLRLLINLLRPADRKRVGWSFVDVPKSEFDRRKKVVEILDRGAKYHESWYRWSELHKVWNLKGYRTREVIRSRRVMKAVLQLLEDLQKDALDKGVIKEKIVVR